MDVVSLFVDSTYSVYSNYEFVLFDVFYQFEWTNVVFNIKKEYIYKFKALGFAWLETLLGFMVEKYEILQDEQI